jgi:hypothetical protein
MGNDARKPTPRDSVRDVLREALRRHGKSKRWLSLQLKKHPGYIHDFLEDGVPHKLPYQHCVKISQLLDIPFAHFEYELPSGILPSQSAATLGHRADVELLAKGATTKLAADEDELRCKVLTGVLDQHPEWPLRPGDLVLIDKSTAALERLTTGSIVLVYLHDKEEERATPILREFVAPSVLISNTADRQLRSILDIRDDSLPFDVLIAGKLTFAGRGNGLA